MEISQIKKNREQMEDTIRDAILKFEKDTGLSVRGIDFQRFIPYTGYNGEQPYNSIIISVDVRV